MPIKSFVLFIFMLITAGYAVAQEKPKPEEVALAMQGVADWQIEHFRNKFSNYPEPHDIRDWTNGAFYVGLMKWISVTGDKRYLEWAKSIGEKTQFKLHDRTYMADDHTVGQLYIELYRHYGEQRMLEPTKTSLEYLMAHPSEEPISIDNYIHFERWTWCDALFMAPPVWAKLGKITGDERYNKWMMAEVKATVDHLYDADEGLFYRDSNYLTKRVNDKKVFWARGNGWVFAGLTLTMDELPKDSADYAYLLKIYLKMADTLVKIQTPQGHWSMSLLNADNFPTPETSGTSFFTYGLAWGVNRGILKDEKYTKAAFKGWAAATSHITKDGMLGYVQPIGAAPGQAWPDKTETYGSGAFLAAGSEIFKLVGGVAPAQITDSKKLKSGMKSANATLDKELKIFNDPKRPRAFARYVPERKDDFAWENDLVAFRAYGPALRNGKEDAGIDCWLKRVKYPIINKWYNLDATQKISYHEDHGEGLDNYHVGASAGCGGSALWINGKREPLETYTRASLQESTPQHVIFTLTYHKTINGDKYTEEKRIMLKMGSRMYAVESTFRINGKIIENLPIAVGVTTHDGNAVASFDQKTGWLSTWGRTDGFGLGTGIFMDPKTIVQAVTTYDANTPDSSHALYIANTDSRGKIFYYAGYGWEKAKEIRTAEEWQAYLTKFAADYKTTQAVPKH